MTFPSVLVKLVESEASRIGFDFQDYVRLVLAIHVQSGLDDLEMVDKVTEKRIGEALKSLEEGDPIIIRDKRELYDFLEIDRKKKK